jgi:hypothetical protein
MACGSELSVGPQISERLAAFASSDGSCRVTYRPMAVALAPNGWTTLNAVQIIRKNIYLYFIVPLTFYNHILRDYQLPFKGMYNGGLFM